MGDGLNAFVCAGCGLGKASRVRRYYPITDYFREVLPDLYIYRCSACGLVQVNHQAVSLDKLVTIYYRDLYRTTVPLNPLRLHNKYTVRAWVFRDLIRKYFIVSPAAIFEPGCGFGHSLVYFRRTFPGCRVFTNELDTKSLGADICFFDPSDGSGRLFDVILMSHFLEHVVRPAEYIERLLPHIRSGGLLVIEVPNDNACFFRKKLIVEPHVTFFEKQTLLEFFKRFDSRLEVLDCFTAKGTDVLEPVYDGRAVFLYYLRYAVRRSVPLVLRRWIRGLRPSLETVAVDPEKIRLSLIRHRYRMYSAPAGENEGWGLRLVLRKR